MKLEQVQSIAFALADGAAVVFPVAAPLIAGIEAIILAAEQAGIAPHELSAEQAQAIAAGMAAARASAVTSFKARKP